MVTHPLKVNTRAFLGPETQGAENRASNAT